MATEKGENVALFKTISMTFVNWNWAFSKSPPTKTFSKMLPAYLQPPSFYADLSWSSQKDFQASPLPLPWIQLIKSTQLKKFGQNSSFPLFLFLLLPQNFSLHSCWFQQEKMELPVAFGTFGGVVCPPTTARAPATRSQAEKEESRVSGTLLTRET